MLEEWQPAEERSGRRRAWSLTCSVVLQSAGTAFLALMPLINTYELDLGVWDRISLRLSVPPPPAPPPPQAAPAPAPAPRRYEADFRSPVAIPATVARLHDIGAPVSPMVGVAAPSGPEGGLGEPGVAGVLGMVPALAGALPLPPPIRVGGRVQNARIVTRVLPVYPPEAVENHVSGVVKLEAVIGTDGTVRDLHLLEGHPMLVPAAIEAVSQWKYLPTLLNGREVEVVTLIDVRFNLTVLTEEEDARDRGRRERNRRQAQP